MKTVQNDYPHHQWLRSIACSDRHPASNGHEDKDEEGTQHDLEGLDSNTLKCRFANEVGSFMPLSQLMIILQHIQWGREYGAQDDDKADRQDDDDDHPVFNTVDEHLDFGNNDNDNKEEEEETTRAQKVWWFPSTYNLLLKFINRRSANVAWSTALR